MLAAAVALSLVVVAVLVEHQARRIDDATYGWSLWLVSRLLLGGAAFVVLGALLAGCGRIERVDCGPMHGAAGVQCTAEFR